MMRTVAFTLLSLLLWVGSASAQITVPNTFVASTRIVSADVNQNFSTLGTNALNRTGGTMTGTLTTLGIVPTTNNASDIGASGTRYANVYSVQGNFSGALTAERVGVGGSPSASMDAGNLQVSGGVMSSAGSAATYTGNLYYDGTDARWEYFGNGYGIAMQENGSGGYTFHTAPNNASGAGAAATLTSRFAIGNTGAVTVPGTLGVTGATTLSSTLGVTGAATLSSTLVVTGATTLSGAVTASSSVTVGYAVFTAQGNGSSADPGAGGYTCGTTVPVGTMMLWYASGGGEPKQFWVCEDGGVSNAWVRIS